MMTLPESRRLPASMTEEKVSVGYASLALTPELLALMATIIQQWKRRDLFAKLAKHNIHPIRQVFMYGPPGNGKTTASQCLASELGLPLYRVRCESLVGNCMGDTAREVRKMMDWLANAGGAVVLFDEVETIFLSRVETSGTLGREISSAMAVFWQMLDRWTAPQLFCFATNMAEKLDPALLSRFELKIEFGPPTQDQIRSVVSYWSEVFHEYAPDQWGPVLSEHRFESFRALWQSIASSVRNVALTKE